MISIEAVLFDYGLVLSAPPVPAAWERMKSIIGLDEPGLQAGYWAPRHAYDRGTHTGPEYWHLVAGHSGLLLDNDQVNALIAADTDLWGGLNQPMIDWVHRLQHAGIRTGILSNMGDAMAAGLLEKHTWLDKFDHHTWSNELKLAKPEPAIYHHAIAGIATDPTRILFIDDKPENISAAVAAGMQAICYSTFPVFEQEMTARGLDGLLTL